MVGVIATPSYTIFMVKILAEFSVGGVKADVQKNKISVKLFSLKKKKKKVGHSLVLVCVAEWFWLCLCLWHCGRMSWKVQLGSAWHKS